MLLFSVICWEFLAVVRLHLVKLFFPRKTRKKEFQKQHFFSWVVISLAKNSSNWTNMFYKQFTACLALSTPTSALTLSLWADLIFLLVHCSRFSSPGADFQSQEAMPLAWRSNLGWENFQARWWTPLLGTSIPNPYLEPKWPPFSLEFRPCFSGVDLQK